MSDRSRCSVCQQRVYRNRDGKVLLHTKNVQGNNYGDPLRAVVCEGSDRGARP